MNKVVIGLIAGLFFLLTLGGTLLARLYSHYSHKSLSDEIEQAQIRSVSESLSIVLSGKNRGQRTNVPQVLNANALKSGILLAYRKEKGVVAGEETKKEAAKLAEGVLKIREKVETLARGESIKGGMDGVRDSLSRLMSFPLYQSIENQDSEAVNFLQYLAIKFIAADGAGALRNYGRKCLGVLQGDAFTTSQLADLMSDFLKKPGFSNEMPSYLLYAACHPLIIMHAAVSVQDPLGYNAAEGNPNFSAHCFELDGKKMTFYYGPGPTGNPTFEHGILPAYEKFGVFELRFNHQDTSSRSEYHRVKELQRIGDENPSVLRHALLGFDTKMKKNNSVVFDDPDTFFASYRKYVKEGVRGHHIRKDHSGFYIPAHLLSDSQVEKAVLKAQEFCKALSRNNRYWNQAMQEKGPKGIGSSLQFCRHTILGDQKALVPLQNPGKARMAKMMQLVTDTYLTLAMLYRSFDAADPEIVRRSLDEKLDKDLIALRTSGACKQNVDRAVVENISLRLFFRWASNPKPLTREEVYDIAGAVFGRARLVDDRKILSKRYQILDDLLRFIGSAPGGIAEAHSLLKGYRQALKS